MKKAWPKVRLGEVLTHRKEFIQIDDLTSYKRPRVQLHAQGIVLRDEVPGALIKTKKQQVCRAGDFLVAEIDAKVGGFGIVPESLEDALVSSHYFLFEINTEKLDHRFLDYFIRTPMFRDQVEAQGSTNYAAIRPGHVLGYEIPLPSLEEQRRLVARIEKLAGEVNEAIAFRDMALEEIDALWTSQAGRIFAALENHPTCAISNLGEYNTNPVQTGPFGAQLHSDEFVDNGIPVLNVGNVWPEGLRLERLDHVTPSKAAQLGRYSLRVGDLLFARTGATLGKVCIVPEGCDGWLMTGHLFRVRFDNKMVYNRFAFYALHASRIVREQVFGHVRGATRPGFNTKLLSNVKLPLPPMSKQHEIVEELDTLKKEIDALKGKHACVRKEMQALMPIILDRAFNGEL